VLTELGQACRSGDMIAEAHRALADAVSLAHRLGDEDRELAAAVAFGAPALWGSREWGEADTGLVPLLERQLSRVAGTDPSRRIRILSTLATELAHDQGHDRGWGYAADALEAARGLGRPEEFSLAVNAYLVFAHMTDRVGEGRQLMDEMTAAGDQVSVPVQALIQANLLTERIRSAELARFDAEFPAAWRLAADELRSPELRGQLRFIQSSRFLVAGDVGQATEAAALGLAWRGDLRQARDIAGRWFTPPPRTWTRMQAIAYWPAWPGGSAGPRWPPGTPGPEWRWIIAWGPRSESPASASSWPGSPLDGDAEPGGRPGHGGGHAEAGEHPQAEPGRDGYQSRAPGDQRAQRRGGTPGQRARGGWASGPDQVIVTVLYEIGVGIHDWFPSGWSCLPLQPGSGGLAATGPPTWAMPPDPGQVASKSLRLARWPA
jgi:hypothetical protein